MRGKDCYLIFSFEQMEKLIFDFGDDECECNWFGTAECLLLTLIKQWTET